MSMHSDVCSKVEFVFDCVQQFACFFPLVNNRLCKCEKNPLAVSQKGLLVVKLFANADVPVLEIKEAHIQICVKDD